MWQAATAAPLWWRVLVGVAIGALIFVGLPEALRYTNNRERKSWQTSPGGLDANAVAPSAEASPQPAPSIPPPTAAPVPAKKEPRPSAQPDPRVVVSAPGGIATVNQSGGQNTLIVNNPPVNPTRPVVTYGFNGMKRTSTPGKLIADPTLVMAFEELSRLELAKDWPALLSRCEAEIRNVPEWLTPLVLKARALAELGKFDEAIPLLESVDQRTRGDAEYDVARQLLEQIRHRRSGP